LNQKVNQTKENEAKYGLQSNFIFVASKHLCNNSFLDSKTIPKDFTFGFIYYRYLDGLKPHQNFLGELSSETSTYIIGRCKGTCKFYALINMHSRSLISALRSFFFFMFPAPNLGVVAALGKGSIAISHPSFISVSTNQDFLQP
jgi:hypothetical protein